MDLPVKNLVSEIDLKPSDAFLPLFESTVNAIISLKLTKGLEKEAKKIQIQIERDRLPAGLFTSTKTVKSFKIIDNGEGFTALNFASFKTAYSRKNKQLGCKGIGRFTILAAFEEIKIRSTYKEGGKWFFREFIFNADEEVKLVTEGSAEENKLKTVVELINCYNPIVKDYTAKSVQEVAELIMQHCLVYYLCGDLPRIEILDLETNEGVVVNDLYQSVSKEREKDFKVQAKNFNCYVTRTPKEGNRKNHYIHYCANSRVVGSPKSIARVNGIFAYPIIDNGNGYFLDVYVVSTYLDKKVYGARNGFSIPQEKESSLFNAIADEMSFEEIEIELAKVLEEEYDSFVKDTQDRNVKELRSYILEKAPRYNRYANRPEILSSIPPNLSEDKKEEFLYKISFAERKSIDSKIQNFIESKSINEETIDEVKQELIEKSAFDADSLSDYMLRRKAIIDLFVKFLEADESGQYRLEEDIHNLIIPMGVVHEKIDYESHNLWLLDERFATYSFIASDKPITSFSQKKSRNEPDICMLENPIMFDNPISFGSNASGEISSLVIFEFKRPGDTAHQKRRSDMRWEFSELIDDYFDDFLYSDNKKNYKGRQVIVHKDTPKFGYVVVDVIPPKLKEYNIDNGFKPTPFGTLYRINPDLNLHIEVITFHQLIEAVKKRHAPFFDKLFN